MKIPYRKFIEYLPVDINELIPEDSYKKLTEKSTHSIDDLIKKYGEIFVLLPVKNNGIRKLL